MRLIAAISVFILFLFLLSGCKEDDTGTLIFKGVDQIPSLKSEIYGSTGQTSNDQDDPYMHTANIKFSIAEIWVSPDQIIQDNGDNYTWFKIGESTGLKFPSEYEFVANNLPEGDYRSIKIAFRNVVIRYAVYRDDTTQAIEMRGSLDESGCETEDIITNYFCSTGNYSLLYNPYTDTSLFNLAAKGETIRGFKIQPGQTTNIYWKLGWPGAKLTDCSFIWADLNGNKSWDCSIDTARYFDCLPEYHDMPMWTFAVDDGEIVPEDTTDITEDPKFVIDTNYSVTDVVGNLYKAVKIGNQVWMAKNLRTNKFNDNSQINNVPADSSWIYRFTNQMPAQSVYNNNDEFLSTYGRFYNWYAVSSGKLCPQGWHIPSKEEWQVLLDYLGENAGLMLRIASGDYWSVAATNESMFSALPSGLRTFEGSYLAVYESAYWWSSSVAMNVDFVYQLNLPGGTTGYTPFDNGGIIEKGSGLCVRCLMD